MQPNIPLASTTLYRLYFTTIGFLTPTRMRGSLYLPRSCNIDRVSPPSLARALWLPSFRFLRLLQCEHIPMLSLQIFIGGVANATSRQRWLRTSEWDVVHYRIERSLPWEIMGSLTTAYNNLRVENQLLYSKSKIINKTNRLQSYPH